MKTKTNRLILLIIALTIVLLVSACKKTEPVQDSTPPEPDPAQPLEKVWDVQANFNVLTPFESPHSLHTRLHDGALDELIPSYDYGMLLPYSNSIVLDDGSLQVSKFGFVTIDGIVVTDLIYDSVDRAEYIHGWYVSETNEALPAYSLSINVTDYDTGWGYQANRVMAACALDGSWITSFDYRNIVFTKDVILLYRDDETLDIDVIDYDGKHLYNMLDFKWANDALEDTWAGVSMEIISDRHAHVRIRSNRFVFVDLLTGNAQATRFSASDPFIEGFAPIGIGIPNTYYIRWGLINTDFKVVISPRYYGLPYFKYGKAIVHRRDNSQFVINTRGDVLFTVPEDYMLERSDFGPIFFMNNVHGTETNLTYFTNDFEEIIPPQGISNESFHPQYLNNGWLTAGNEVGSYLMRENKEYYFPGIDQINFTDGKLIIYGIRNADDHDHQYEYGVKTLDGTDIIYPEPDKYITPVTHNEITKAFIISTGTSRLLTDQDYNPSTFSLIDTNGNTIIQGRGILTYHEHLELYSIQGANHYSWLDIDANPIITIPFLSSTFD